MANTAKITFEADIAAVQAAVGTIQKDIQQKVAKPVESLGKTTGMMAEKTKSSFMAMGQAVRVLAVAVGDTKSEVVNFAAGAALQLSIVAEGVKLLAQAWKATLVAAVAAAGFAIGYWLQKLILGTNELEKQKRAVYGLNAALKETIVILGNWNKAIDDSNTALRSSVVQAQLFGQEGDVQKALHAELQKRIVATTIAIGELAKAQSDVANPQTEIRIKSLRSELNELWERYRKNVVALKDFAAAEQDKIRSSDLAKTAAEQITRAYEEQTRIMQAAEEQAARLSNIRLIEADQLAQSSSSFIQWAVSLKATMADVYDGVAMVGQSISQGLGNAFAQAIVYGQSFKDAMVDMLKSLGAAIISFIVEVIVQQLIWYALNAIGLIQQAAVSLKTSIATGAVAAAKSAYESLPFPANMIAAPIAGAAAIATMTALAAAGAAAGVAASAGLVPGFAEGSIVTGPMLALVGEGGQDELIAPRSDYERLINSTGRGGMLRATINFDGRRAAEAIVPWTPDVVRSRGIRGL